ncbi:MAG: DUF3833 domain-containing protein [Pseudomonadota bacterium]|nr:DUF3833 domain-containing protein [Pseudomonadota bacterium]
MKKLITIFLLTNFLYGCSSVSIEDYSNFEPEFILEDYFQGRTLASGLFMDRFGKVQRQFVVTIDGTWDGTTLILNEDFLYDDGEVENRVWVLTKTDEFTYQGTTENAVGLATGKRNGNAFNWQYAFNLKVGEDYWQVKFNDWMFLQPDGTLLNIAVVSRWGLNLGTVYLSFSKVNDAA